MKKVDRFRFARIYTPTEAARIAQTSPANVRRWLLGYSDSAGKMKPVFGERPDVIASFMDLCEVIVIAGFRKQGTKLDVLRRAHAYAREKFGLKHPFASLQLREYGGHVLHEFERNEGEEQGLVVLSKGGQYTLPGIVEARIIGFDFDELDELAFRWFPHTRKVPIVIDPRFGGGLPTISGRNLRMEVLVGRHKAGQPPKSIAKDFQLELADVHKVLKYAA